MRHFIGPLIFQVHVYIFSYFISIYYENTSHSDFFTSINFSDTLFKLRHVLVYGTINTL